MAINKVVANAKEATKDIKDNMTLMLGGLVYVEYLKTVLVNWLT